MKRSQKARFSTRIVKIAVEGYKSIHGKNHITIGPITLLAGANSSGKSSIFQPLLLLKQTLEASFDPGPLLLDGANVRVNELEQVLSRIGKHKSSYFSIELTTDQGEILELQYSKKVAKRKGGIALTKAILKKDTASIEIIDPTSAIDMESIEGFVPVPFGVIQKLGDLDWKFARNRCFFDIELYIENKKVGSWAFPAGIMNEGYIESIIHIPALRGNPLRDYKTTAVGDMYPGTFEEYVASILLRWQEDGKTELLEQVGKDLECLGLTWKVEARRLDDTKVELRVGKLLRSQRGGGKDLVNIVDVGFGVSQTLPVVVALLAAYPDQIVYLEQPEIHLHPRAQTALAELIVRAANRGVKIVVETHSTLLLRGIQTLVAKKQIAPADVYLHWFQRTEEGVTQITATTLDEDGAFGDWPEDFDETLLKSEQQYLDAVVANMERQRDGEITES